MNKVGRYLWLALVVVVVVTAVVANLDKVRDFKVRDFLQQQLDSFLKRPLISQIIIGFVVWLILVIVPCIVFWSVFWYVVGQPEEGQGLAAWGCLFAFLIVWPPAWPIAVILLPVLWITK